MELDAIGIEKAMDRIVKADMRVKKKAKKEQTMVLNAPALQESKISLCCSINCLTLDGINGRGWYTSLKIPPRVC